MSLALSSRRPRVAPPEFEHRRFRGASGLDELAAGLRCVAPDPSSFAADLTVVRIAGVSVRRATATPMRWSSRASAGGDGDTVRFVAVVRGRLRIGRPGASGEEIGERAVVAVQERDVQLFRADQPVDVVTVVLPASMLPPHPRLFADGPVHAFPSSPIAQAVHDLVVSFSSGPPSSARFDPVYAANGLICLLGAMVAQESAPRGRVAGMRGLHAAATDLIDRLLQDQDLGPAQLAEELGVSVRYLHRAFEDQDTTVARSIRRRRAELASDAMLLWPDGPAAVGLIARRFGFKDEGALLRVLRERPRGCPPPAPSVGCG